MVGMASLFDTGLVPGSPYVVACVLGASVVMPRLAMMVEKRDAGLADWLGFIVLMSTWVPVAGFAAFTVMAHTWRPTPHGAGVRQSRVDVATPRAP